MHDSECARIFMYIYLCECTCECACAFVCVCVCVCVCLCMCMHANMCVICMRYVGIIIYKYIYLSKGPFVRGVHMCYS